MVKKKNMALKKALKEAPCKNNPYGIKCDKKLKRLLRKEKGSKQGGVIQQKQSINIRIGDLSKAKKRQARKTVKKYKLHKHYSQEDRASFAAPVLQTGSLFSQAQLNEAIGNNAQYSGEYGKFRADLIPTLLREQKEKSEALRRSELSGGNTPTQRRASTSLGIPFGPWNTPTQRGQSTPGPPLRASIFNPTAQGQSTTPGTLRTSSLAAMGQSFKQSNTYGEARQTIKQQLRTARSKADAGAAAAQREAALAIEEAAQQSQSPKTPAGFRETDDARAFTFGPGSAATNYNPNYSLASPAPKVANINTTKVTPNLFTLAGIYKEAGDDYGLSLLEGSPQRSKVAEFLPPV
jgi:hypothetical protein